MAKHKRIEKTVQVETCLGLEYSTLAELKGIRNDADFAKQYLAGFYGGVPILSEFLNDKNLEKDGTLGS